VYALNLGNPVELDAGADELLARVQPGPYARVGFADYFTIDMPWTATPDTAPLTAPGTDLLGSILEGARKRGLVFHMSMLGGVSRSVEVYEAARREDRRNAQWFADGALAPPWFAGDFDASVRTAWVTPSRYARKLRRHLEAKVRRFALLFLDLRASFPDTLISASGDSEAELNSDTTDANIPFEDQILADYSPFAILEFRDWLLHTGLYADGAPYGGDGYAKKDGESFEQGPAALSAANLARFNADFGTAFGTWSLEYFDWSLSDPVDGDARAIGVGRFSAPGWSARPAGGPDSIAGGFDAPRFANESSGRFWKLWLEFRETMLANYVQDFARWMTTTKNDAGEVLAPNRWYSHQIPAEYLNGTRPGSRDPEPRLLTSTSPFWTALVGDEVGSPGLTILDRYEPGSLGRPTYARTSLYLFDVIEGLGLPNWGMPEYSPSWPIGVAPDTSTSSIAAQFKRAWDSGAHMFAFTPWPHFVDTADGEAMGDFVDRIRFQPRGTGSTSFAPPAVRGLAATVSGSTASFSWSGQIFENTPGFRWSEWPRFRSFELWRGSTSDFTTSSGRLVRSTTSTSMSSIPFSSSQRFYKIVATSRDYRRGPLSAAIEVGSGTPTDPPDDPDDPDDPPDPTPLGSRPIRSCRVLYTRLADGPTGGPALAPFETRHVDVLTPCNLPAQTTSVTATVAVRTPAEAGELVVSPGERNHSGPLTLSFIRGRSAYRKVSLALAADGTIALESRAPTEPIHLMVYVSGYSQE